MKAQIDLPDSAFEKARSMALDQDLSLSELFTQLLTETHCAKSCFLKSAHSHFAVPTESFDWRDELL